MTTSFIRSISCFNFLILTLTVFLSRYPAFTFSNLLYSLYDEFISSMRVLVAICFSCWVTGCMRFTLLWGKGLTKVKSLDRTITKVQDEVVNISPDKWAAFLNRVCISTTFPRLVYFLCNKWILIYKCLPIASWMSRLSGWRLF